MHLGVLALLIGLYAIGGFVGPYITVPLMRRQQLPSRIPRMLEEDIARIENESSTDYEYLRGCAQYILSQNRAARFGAFIHAPHAYETDTKALLARRGYMHGHHLNHLMRLMIARSARFADERVRMRYTVLNLVLHQYLQVLVAGQWYDLDLVGVSRGLPLGKHAWGIR